MNSSTTPIKNQLAVRYCPTSEECCKKQYVVLRYAPKEPSMINLDTTSEGSKWEKTKCL
jgi:hypothetical protein